jgi:two-component system OmpR family response regulator/two-component system response regulator QseB
MRILVVEDDPLLGDGIRAGLAQAGFATDWVQDGRAGELALETRSHDAVVLDLGLPRLAGIELLRRMRAGANKTPVLILTARDAVEDRIKGLDSGADDYVVKPFDLHELAARLRALIRRSAGEAAPVLRVGEIALDPAARRAQYRGAPLDLPAREYALLHALMLSAGRVLTREQLSERLYAWGEEVESNAIDVHIHHLRRKLAPQLIRTVRGVGYLMPRQQNG